VGQSNRPVPPPYLLEGRYLAEKGIVRGETAEIFSGSDTWSGEQVAIRMLREDRPDRESRFRRMSERLFGATSARLIRAIQMGEDRKDRPFLVTELLVGRDADTLGRVRWEVACEITRQAAAALAELSVLDLHHGNLRASTLFVAASSAGGSRVKLLDLGIGDRMASAAKDVRALASILHKLATGKPPLPPGARSGPIKLNIPQAPPRLDDALDQWLDPKAEGLEPAEVASELKVLVDAASDIYGGTKDTGTRVIPRTSMIVIEDEDDDEEQP